MKNDNIIKSYNNINPDEETKEKMYKNIIESVTNNDSNNNFVIDFTTKKTLSRKLIFFAESSAAIILLALVIIIGSNVLSSNKKTSSSSSNLTSSGNNDITSSTTDLNGVQENNTNSSHIINSDNSVQDNSLPYSDNNDLVKINAILVENNTNMELNLIIVNDLRATISFGQNYYLEKKDGTDWSVVSPISEYSYNEIVFEISAGDKHDAGSFSLEKIYGTLDDGTYRLALQYFVAPYIDSKKLIMYGEFNIGEIIKANPEVNTNGNINKEIDGTYTSLEDANLSSDTASTTILVKYNGLLYGKSNNIIDYASSSSPIDTIDALVDINYVPLNNNETNTEILLNSKVYSFDDNSLVLFYDNEFVLFDRIHEK